ncbi:hypothetical protein ACFSMZ_00385, partial [Chelativorans composti]
NLNLPKLRDDLVGLVSLVGHCGPPSGSKPYFKVDPFNGGGSIGITAIASLYFPEWIPAAALAGAIFYLLAGVQHVRNHPTTAPEIAAMVSDLGIAAILIVYLCSLSF